MVLVLVLSSALVKLLSIRIGESFCRISAPRLQKAGIESSGNYADDFWNRRRKNAEIDCLGCRCGLLEQCQKSVKCMLLKLL